MAYEYSGWPTHSELRIGLRIRRKRTVVFQQYDMYQAVQTADRHDNCDNDCGGNTIARLISNLQHHFNGALRLAGHDPEMAAFGHPATTKATSNSRSAFQRATPAY